MVELDQFKAILEFLCETFSGSEGFTLTWPIRKSGLKSWKERWKSRISGMIRNAPSEMMKELKSLKDDKEIYENLESQR